MTNEKLDRTLDYSINKMERLNPILTDAFNKTRKMKNQYGNYKINIDSMHYSTLGTLGLDKKIQAEVLEYFIIIRKKYVIDLLNNNILLTDDAIIILEEHPGFISNIPDKYIQGREKLINYVIENFDKFKFDMLPKSLANNAEIQKLYNRRIRVYTNEGVDKHGYNSNWIDQNGNLIRYFSLLGDYPITSKNDYLKLVEEYKKSGLTIVQFCNKYQLSSVEGFRNLLERVKSESISEEKELKKISSESSIKFLASTEIIALNIYKKKISLEEYINEYYNSFHTISLFSNYVDNQKELYTLMADQLINYVINNEYNLKICSLASLFEANFELKPASSESDLCNVIYKFIKVNSSKPNYKDFVKVKQIINSYSIPYQRKNIPNSFQFEDKKYEVTNEVIDETLTYMDNNGIYRCMKTFLFNLKKILKGELDYNEEMKQNKKEMIETILILRKKIKEKKDISEYIRTMRKM